jgi:hypothetical protein
MFFDKYLTFDQKVVISIICGGLWIYFRTSECYNMIPRLHIFPVIFVTIWIYLNYYEPLFLPLGLLVLVVYSYLPNIYDLSQIKNQS